MLYIILHPFQLLASQAAQTAGLQVHDVDQSDEMNAFLIKAVPACALGVLAIAFQILLAVVADYVMFAGNIKDILSAGAFQQLVNAIKLFRLGKVCDIAGVKNEARLRRQGIDLVDRRFQRSCNISVGRLVESHMAVTDLDKAQIALDLLAGES